MSINVTYIPGADDLPTAYMGGASAGVPVIEFGEVTVMLQPSRPEHAVAYLTALIAEATALLAKVQEAQS
jgi:hypothetical protein